VKTVSLFFCGEFLRQVFRPIQMAVLKPQFSHSFFQAFARQSPPDITSPGATDLFHVFLTSSVFQGPTKLPLPAFFSTHLRELALSLTSCSSGKRTFCLPSLPSGEVFLSFLNCPPRILISSLLYPLYFSFPGCWVVCLRDPWGFSM